MAGKDDSPPGSSKPVRPGDPLDLATSVAGEEDPGAAIDIAQDSGSQVRSEQPAPQPNLGRPDMAPGDEAPPGTPSSAERVCPQCGGSGRLGAATCPDCLGTGRVIVGIGAA